MAPSRGGSALASGVRYFWRVRVRDEKGARTGYGETGSGWELRADSLVVTARIPPNAHGTVHLPGASLASVSESGTPLDRAAGVGDTRQVGADVVLEVGSGDYRFAWPVGTGGG